MRQLTEEDLTSVLDKLSVYIGKNISCLLEDKKNPHAFRIQKNRVYYVSENLIRHSSSINKKKLSSLGVCFGKITKKGKFKLHITALPYLAQYAKYKLWIKQNGEMSFLYGNNILKAQIGKISDDVPEHAGIVVYNINDIPLGFGISSKSTNEIKNLQPTGIVVLRQADIGEYLRSEETLFS